MGYDRGDWFPFDFEPNGIPFGSKLKGKLSPRSYPIQCKTKWKYSFLSADMTRAYLGFPPHNNLLLRENVPALLCILCGKATMIKRTAVFEELTSLGIIGDQLGAP